MPTWRVAKSLEKLWAQVNALAPSRNTASDGTIGDAAHRATKSEHNPDANGVVRAMDITHDPANGVDCNAIVASLVASKDRRILYVIWNRRMWRSYEKTTVKAWEPGVYTGLNSHSHHLHISVVEDPALYDSEAPWSVGTVTTPSLPQPPRQPDVEPPPAQTTGNNAPTVAAGAAIAVAGVSWQAFGWLGPVVVAVIAAIVIVYLINREAE